MQVKSSDVQSNKVPLLLDALLQQGLGMTLVHAKALFLLLLQGVVKWPKAFV